MLELIDARDQQTPLHIPRPQPVERSPAEAVRAIVEDVRLRGDAALVEHAAPSGRGAVTPDQIAVDPGDVDKARALVPPELLAALTAMADSLRATCERQLPHSWLDRGSEWVTGELVRPVRRAGICVAGGRAPRPSTVIMAAVPARVAGVGGVAVCSPPGAGGDISEAVLAACSVAGVTEVYRAGGAHGVAALAYGTESVRPVDKIVGTGDAHVMLAMRLVQGWVDTKAEAGPAELVVVAGETASPRVIAADLVAAAERGPHGSQVLITWMPELAEHVIASLEIEITRHRNADDLENSLIEGGTAVLVRDLDQAFEIANAFAPAHLELAIPGASDALDRVRNAGAVYLGPNSGLALGAYVAGIDHLAPAGGAARWTSALGAQDFVTRTYVSGAQPGALDRAARDVEVLAEAEGLHGHARALAARLERRAVPRS